MHSVVIPCVLIASANAYTLWNEHWEHKAHEQPMEEKPEYQYQNIRTKNFFWGDGDKVSLLNRENAGNHEDVELVHFADVGAQTLFWNEKVNYHKPQE